MNFIKMLFFCFRMFWWEWVEFKELKSSSKYEIKASDDIRGLKTCISNNTQKNNSGCAIHSAPTATIGCCRSSLDLYARHWNEFKQWCLNFRHSLRSNCSWLGVHHLGPEIIFESVLGYTDYKHILKSNSRVNRVHNQKGLWKVPKRENLFLKQSSFVEANFIQGG